MWWWVKLQVKHDNLKLIRVTVHTQLDYYFVVAQLDTKFHQVLATCDLDIYQSVWAVWVRSFRTYYTISLADGHDGLFSDVLIIGVLELIKGYTGGYTVIKILQWTLTGPGLSYSNLEIFPSNPSDLLG